jgi:hypothetical protein
LVEGEHTFYIRATDSAGIVQEPPTAYTYRVDGTGPTTISDVAPNTILRQPQDADGNWLLPLSGTISDPDLPGGQLSQIYGRIVAPDGSTTWAVAQHDGNSWQLWATLTAEGPHMIWLEAWDEAGNVSRYGPFLVTAEVEDVEIGWQVYLPAVIKP